MSNLPVPVSRGSLVPSRADRALVKHAKTLQRRAEAVRVEDAARCYVAAGRMRDSRDLTETALTMGGEVADCLAAEVSARPFFANELMDIASTGAHGLKAELRGYIEGCR